MYKSHITKTKALISIECYQGERFSMLKVNIMLYMNHVIHHIDTPTGLTPPHLLPGGWEGKVIAMLRPGQTLALAEPEARHYNHPGTAPPPPPQQMFVLLAISQPFLNGLS